MPLRCLFRIHKESFRKLDSRLAELGGYEYDARMEELIIKTLPGALREGVVNPLHTRASQSCLPRWKAVANGGSTTVFPGEICT
jgi:hypothetical protein